MLLFLLLAASAVVGFVGSVLYYFFAPDRTAPLGIFRFRPTPRTALLALLFLVLRFVVFHFPGGLLMLLLFVDAVVVGIVCIVLYYFLFLSVLFL